MLQRFPLYGVVTVDGERDALAPDPVSDLVGTSVSCLRQPGASAHWACPNTGGWTRTADALPALRRSFCAEPRFWIG